MKELYSIQPDDYANVSLNTFQLSTNGSVVKLDTQSSSPDCKGIGTLRLKTGNPVTWRIFKNPDIKNASEGWASLTDNATNKSMRHCNGVVWASPYEANNVDFGWLLYKQPDGSYQVFNGFGNGSAGSYLGYDASSDSLKIQRDPFNWTIVPTTAPAPAPAAPPAPAPAPAPAAPNMMPFYIGGGILMCCCCLLIMMFFLLK